MAYPDTIIAAFCNVKKTRQIKTKRTKMDNTVEYNANILITGHTSAPESMSQQLQWLMRTEFKCHVLTTDCESQKRDRRPLTRCGEKTSHTESRNNEAD